MAGFAKFPTYLLRKSLSTLNRRLVSTSKRNPTSVTSDVTKVKEATTKTAADKNWIPYGFDYNSKAADRNAMHSIMFVSVTLCLTVGTFYWAYIPDTFQDWAHREAFLELRRREAKGLPLVDANLIDPSKVVLPSDEELGDTEIII